MKSSWLVWSVGIAGALIFAVGTLEDGLDASDTRSLGIVIMFLTGLYWLSKKARIDAACELAYKEGWEDRGRYEDERRKVVRLIRSRDDDAAEGLRGPASSQG
jgi:hypothetical protein